MSRKFNYPILYILLFNLLLASNAVANEDFPGRKQYSNVAYITLDDLYKKLHEVIIVDTRSNYEFNTLHIKDAINIPISRFDFSKRIQKLHQEIKKPIVFYCNGHNCLKSYEAVYKAKYYAKVNNSYAYDGGIDEWANNYPELSVLLGQYPADHNKLIPSKEFQKHLLKPADFLEKTKDNCIVVDVRDGPQRHEHIFSGFEYSVRLDRDDLELLNIYIDKSRKENQALCIYDAVGKQVRWLQYYLKENKFQNYYFMEGGAMAFSNMSKTRLYGN